MQGIAFSEGWSGQEADITALFYSAFSASEGAVEGRRVSDLVGQLIGTTPKDDLRCMCAYEHRDLAGAIFFSRLRYPEETSLVFLLSPVAVATDYQGRGVGQALLRYGIGAMREEGIDVLVTYGDPAFYGRVGFEAVSVKDLPAPQVLSHPLGWIAQRLDGCAMHPHKGPAKAVAAFDDPALW
ncbi:MAG: N-acetyltransferase [Pseudomonadota bacterium]